MLSREGPAIRKDNLREESQFARDAAFRLAKYRNSRGESPEVFAARLGMTARAYMAYERGERHGWGWTHLTARLAQSDLPISLGWLFCGDGPMNRGNPKPTLRAIEGGAA